MLPEAPLDALVEDQICQKTKKEKHLGEGGRALRTNVLKHVKKFLEQRNINSAKNNTP